MEDSKIKDLTEKATGAATDEFVINDVAGGNVDKKIGMDGIRITESQITDLGTYQTQDTDLTAIAGLSPTNDDIIQRKAGAWTNRTIAQLRTDLNVEDGADVTDATNVNAAGATMNTDTDVSLNSWVLDEDNMASDSATKVPTQQSVKAYADTKQSSITEISFTDVIPCTMEIPQGSVAYPDIHSLATATTKVSGFVFPDGASSATINFKVITPEDLATSPGAQFRFRFITLTAQTDKDVRILSKHIAVADGENLDQALANTDSAGEETVRMPNTIEYTKYYTADFQTQPVAGDTLIGQVTRDPTDTSDNFVGDIMLIGVDLIIDRKMTVS